MTREEMELEDKQFFGEQATEYIVLTRSAGDLKQKCNQGQYTKDKSCLNCTQGDHVKIIDPEDHEVLSEYVYCSYGDTRELTDVCEKWQWD